MVVTMETMETVINCKTNALSNAVMHQFCSVSQKTCVTLLCYSTIT